MEGVDASVMELTAIFYLGTTSPRGHKAHKDACVQKGSWRNILWWVSDDLGTRTTAGKIFFEQVRLLLYGY